MVTLAFMSVRHWVSGLPGRFGWPRREVGSTSWRPSPLHQGRSRRHIRMVFGVARRPRRLAPPSRERFAMPSIECLVETGVYADDLDAAERFYRDFLGLTHRGKEAGRHVFFQVGDRGMLLSFPSEATLVGDPLPAH